MATYDELRSLFGAGPLRQKIEVAVVVAAQTIITGSDAADPPWDQTAGQHELRAKWANDVLTSTASEAVRLWKCVLAANKGQSVATIMGASDSTIQDNVNESVDAIASAIYG